MRGIFIAVLLMGFASASTRADSIGAATRADAIYRCAGPDGEAYFTDRTCPEGELQTFDPANVLTIPAPDAHDMARVQRLDKEQAARERSMEKERAAQQRAATRDAAARARSCAAAHEGLERVHQIKRRGYAVASSADLQARERRYNLLAERNCG